MVTLVYYLHLLNITICIICLLLPSSNGGDNKYETCYSSLFSCGTVKNVGYPFWGDGQRPPYCGHPSLELQCLKSKTGDQLVLEMGGEPPYNVLDMKYPDHRDITLTLRWLENDIPCSFNMTEFSEVIKFSPSVAFITLLYNCPRHIPSDYLHSSIPCQVGSTKYQAYYLSNISALKEYASCKSFQFPVFGNQLDLYNKGIGQLTDVMDKGFEVSYEYSEICLNCMKSNGLCGSYLQSDNVCIYKESALSKGIKLASFVGAAVLGVIGMIIAMLFCLTRRRTTTTTTTITTTTKFTIFWKSKATKSPNVDAFLQIYGSFALTRYTHTDIKKMTDNFKVKLGEGGYAIVYKGKLLSGRLVAVKVLKQSKGDGEDFLNEVASISRTNHVNVVALLGFCFEGNEKALVYEFLPNGSLEKFTYHGASASNQSLPWEKVFSIVIGIARGLDYLHRGCNAQILHFDIKPHNILLDEEFCPKISDFGLARLCPLQESTISMLEARGTIGYIAPEVFCRTIGGVSHKSDVYSFGMMVLDMVCGRKNLSADLQRSSEVYFPQWIYDQLELSNEAVFQGSVNGEEEVIQRKMILVSLWCIQTYPSNRPSMSRVVDMLQGCLESLEVPPKPNQSSPPRLALDAPRTLTVVTGTSLSLLPRD